MTVERVEIYVPLNTRSLKQKSGVKLGSWKG